MPEVSTPNSAESNLSCEQNTNSDLQGKNQVPNIFDLLFPNPPTLLCFTSQGFRVHRVDDKYPLPLCIIHFILFVLLVLSILTMSGPLCMHIITTNVKLTMQNIFSGQICSRPSYWICNLE